MSKNKTVEIQIQCDECKTDIFMISLGSGRANPPLTQLIY